MYPITNEVKALFESEQRQILRITGTDKNGIAINITDEDIVLNSFNIDRCSCNGEKLEVGTAIASEMTFKLDNFDGRYNSVVFEGTELFVEIGIADWTQTNPTIYWMPCGYFTPDEQPRTRDIITIHALDRMIRFDVVPPVMTPWVTQGGDYVTDSQGNIIYFLSNVRFPISVRDLVWRITRLCGVPFTQDISSFPNYLFTLSGLPNLQQQVTFRNMIQWCAGIMGANAYIDWNGELRFAWYNNSGVYTLTPSNRFSGELAEDTITVTGLQYTNTQGVTVISGTGEYALDMTGNYLMTNGASDIMAGMRPRVTAVSGYKPFTASILPAPFLWPMDSVYYVDADDNLSLCIVTNVNFGINGSTELEGKGETEQTNSGTAPLGMTTEQAFFIEKAAQATQDLDDSLTQEEIFNRLTDNGETQGLIMYNGKIYLNAEYIQAGTILANLLMGRTLTVGGNVNGNGSIRVLDINGNVISQLDRYGITVNKGDINGTGIYLGGQNNAPGKLVVRDANRNQIGRWDETGINLNKGTIAGPSIALGGNNNTDGVLTVKDANGQVTCRLDNTGGFINGTFDSNYTDPDSFTNYRLHIADGEIGMYENNIRTASIGWNEYGVGIGGNSVSLVASNAAVDVKQNDVQIMGRIYNQTSRTSLDGNYGQTVDISYVKSISSGIPVYGTIQVQNGLIIGVS